ncbi:aldehyde dehydrogenase family protein [Actinoplanes sp. NPDC051861]|uniref:aldehyde dehydrogenase family protein n=1 Tax=Actinoplanes sp. NPDC051861 TaxID=3155170 RepID=UPI003443AA9D
MIPPSTLAVVDPSTGAVFAEAPVCGPEQLDRVMAEADRAFRDWRCAEETRRSALRRAAEVVRDAREELAALITAEQGRPVRESMAEVMASVTWLRYYADLEPDEILVRGDARVTRRPLGVVAAITPWNHPLAIAVWKLAPALRAGNAVVLKPSPYTPLTTLRLGELLRDVLPPGVFTVVTGPEPLGAWMTAHPVPRKVSFTGSPETGRRVAVAAAASLKRMTLELGGNDPAVLLDDADPEKVADGVFWGAFANNGQRCMALKRLYVPRGIHDEVVEALAVRAREVPVGAGADRRTRIGPVSLPAGRDRVAALVRDAVSRGASVAAGGRAPRRAGYFYAPTVLGGADDGMPVVDCEQFGPVLPVVPCRDVDDAVARANASPYALTASVWSADPDRAAAVATRLDAGQVSVNTHAGGVRPDLPFGGHKESGLGVENGPWAVHAHTDLHVLVG